MKKEKGIMNTSTIFVRCDDTQLYLISDYNNRHIFGLLYKPPGYNILKNTILLQNIDINA